VHTPTHTPTYTYTYTQTHTPTHTSTHAHTHVCMYDCAYVVIGNSYCVGVLCKSHQPMEHQSQAVMRFTSVCKKWRQPPVGDKQFEGDKKF